MKNEVNRTFTVKKNKFTNFLNCFYANTPQNLGGGNSHSSTVVTPIWKGSRPTVSRRSTDSQSQDHRNHTPINKALKYAAMILMVLTLGVGNAWGANFTASQIVANSGAGTTTSNITCSSSNTAVASKKVKNTNQDVVYLDVQVDTCIITKVNYVQVQAATGYTLDGPVVAQGCADDNSAGNVAILLWKGDYNTSKADSVIVVEAPSRQSTTVDEFSVAFPSGRFRTLRFYRRVSYNPTGGVIGKDCPGTSSYRYGGMKLSIQSITATATAFGGGGGGCTNIGIGTQPTTPVAATIGSACSISGLVASGTNPTYQWQTCNSDGTGAADISAAGAMSFTGYTTATLGLIPTAEGATYYKCVVSGDCGDPVTSNVVTVNASPAFNVSYNDNGKTGGGAAPSDATAYASGAEVTVLGNPNDMTKTNCLFIGWNTKADGTGTIYMEGDKFNMPSENITLYAMWGVKLSWVVQVNVEETTVTTTSTASSYPTAVANPTNLALNDLTVTASKKGTATNKISTTKTKSGYISATFAVQDGYEFTPTHMALKTTAITEAITVEVNVGDEVQTWAQPKSGANPDLHVYKFADPEAITGTGTMKIYAYGGEDGTKGYRLGTPIEIYGFVAEVPAPDPSTKRVYLKCGSTWCDASPKFFVHSWGSADDDAELTQMTGCETDVYYVDIPSGNTSLLFTRQKNTTTEIIYEGDDFWGKSQNITIGDNDLFTCTGWSDGLATFSGSTYAAPTYTISFAGNGNTDGSMSNISSLACGANQALTANAFTKSGYSFANWTADVAVTVGGETVSVGSAIANQATIQNISSDITLTAQWTQEIPSEVIIGGSGWRYFPGQTITLTANTTGGTSDFTYQWQKYVTDAWQDIEGADEDTYTKANCTISDCGSYRCVVSKLGGSVASDGYDVHIYTLNGNYDGSDWESNDLTLVSGTTGQVELSLEAGRLYEFKVKDNFYNYWFGNANYMLKSTESALTCTKDGNDIRVFTGAEGTYTFTVDINHAGDNYVEVSVAYPSVTHPVAGFVYYDKGSNDWDNVAAHWWKSANSEAFTEWNSDPWLTQSVEICGTTYYYMPKLEGYNRVIFHNAAGDGQTGDITVDASSSGKYISGNSTEWASFPAYTVSFNSNGGSAVAEQEVPCGGTASEPTAPTRLNYDFEGWQLNGVDYNFAATVSDDITLDAVWTRKAVAGIETDITLVSTSATIGSTSPLTDVYYGNADWTYTGNAGISTGGAMFGTPSSKKWVGFTIPANYTATVEATCKKDADHDRHCVLVTEAERAGQAGDATFLFDISVNTDDLTATSASIEQGAYCVGSTSGGLTINSVIVHLTYLPMVKLKVLGSVTQTISITVGEKLGEIFASGSLPTPSLPDGYTFKGWKNEANDADVNNNTVTTGSMVIYADIDAPASTDATLSALTVNGDAATVNALDPTKYTFTLPFGTTAVPTVVATPTDANAVATVTANTLSGATIEVVPETGEDDKVTYTITYSIVASKDIRMVWKTTGNPCGESSAPSAVVLSTNDAIKDYLSISFVQTTDDNSKKAEEKSGSYLSTGKSVDNLVKITAKPGFAFKNMSFYGKIETNESYCPVSIDGGETWTNVTGDLGSDAQHCDVFTNEETHEIILKNNAGSGTWIRHMDLTMIQACTPKTIAWTAEPAAEYELGSSPDPIAASANNGTVSYASTDDDVIAVNSSNGALTLKALGTVALSASVPAGNGVTYCDEGAQVSKANVKTYYLVTFNAQNETTPATVKYYKNDAAIALPEDPTYSGFNFLGWFDAETGGTQITEAITPTASRTIYAQWEAQCAGPTITTQPASANYFVGRSASALSCEATPGVDGKALTYTWYSCDDAERTNPVALAGAPTPSTAAVGTFYYYCAVTEADCDVVRNSNVATIAVTEKDKVCLVKADLQAGDKNASISAKTGSYKDDANIAIHIAKNLKLGETGNYVKLGVTGTSFANGDEVVITLVDDTAIPAWLQVFAGTGSDLLAERKSGVTAGANTLTISNVPANQKVLYLYRTSASGTNMNPFVQSMAVYRACPAPILEGISFNSTDAEADELNDNTFNVELTNGTNLASLEVVRNVMWVGAHATTPYTILTNEGAWAWGENTYRVMDKDGDYADYTINLTEALPDAETPVIATDLTDHAYCAGEIPELDATANEVSDGGTLTYQWFNAEGAIEGAISATYTPEGEGSYYCKVTNTLAEHRPMTTTSATAELTQKAATSISGETTFDIEQGATVKFQPTITGANATYAWYACDAEGNHEGDALGTSASYTTAALSTVGTFYYVLEVTADCGSASQIFTVNVAAVGVDLVAHTPGHYYGQTLKVYNGRSYEIYGMSRISSKNYLWAGTPISASTDENCVLAFNNSGETTWLTNSVHGQNDSYTSISNAKQFTSDDCSGYTMHYRAAHSLVLKVKGYDQFSIYSKDNSGSTKYMEVLIDGVVVKSTAKNSFDVYDFDLTEGEHVIVMRGNAESSGSNNELSQFSLRLPVVAKVDETDYLFVQDAIDAASAPITITMLENSYEDIVIANGKDVTIDGDGHTLNSITVENGGKVNASSAMTLVENLYLEAQAGASGQVLGATNVTANAVYMDVRFFEGAETLDETTANRWYMISAPFDVNLADGFYKTDGTPMVFGQTDGENIFDLFEYDGNKRATTGVTGWKRVQGKMKAGRACLIGFNPGQPTTIRLKAASTVLSEPTSITLNAYVGDDANQNWNGVANPTMHYTNLSCDVQTYNNEDGENGRKYIAYSSSSTSFVVGTAFFVQATGTIDLSEATHGELRAPKRNAAERIEYCVRIARSEATAFADQMYVRASETASSEYEQGHDMITWNGTTANTALIWAENYGKRLAIEEAPLANDKASYQLGIYAPVAGEYRIEVASPREDATLYLTKNGRIFWNLTMGACELDLAQGQNNEYGLLLRAEAPAVTTGMDEIRSEAGVQKIIIDENVFILRGEQLFDMTGKLVK